MNTEILLKQMAKNKETRRKSKEKNNMAKFRVKYRSIGYVYLDVEADTLEDAKEIAKNTDDGEFIESGFGYLEYDCTEDENGNLIDQ
mgnify:FL=1